MSDDKQRKLFPAWRAVAAAVVAKALRFDEPDTEGAA